MNKLFVFLLMCILSTTACAQDTTQVVDTIPRSAPTINLPNDTPLLMTPVPEIYKKWWKDMEKCTKLKVSDEVINNIKFYMILSPFFYVENKDNMALAVTYPMLSSIYVSANYLVNKEIIEHEMVHVLMYHNGLEFWLHPDKYYGKGKCAMKADDFQP